MGCGVSKDCIADQTHTQRKRKFIHACREHFHSALRDVPSGSPPCPPAHDYIHLRETPTLEEQGESESAEAENDEGNEPAHAHVHVDDAYDDGNAEEAITINHDELEYLENKPPSTQPLPSHSRAHTQASGGSSLPGPQKPPSQKSPLRELSISSNGKLVDVKKDHHGTPTIFNTSTPRSNQYLSGICPSRPGVKTKSNSCSPLHVDRVKPLSPIQAWNPQNCQNSSFIKAFADHQLCKEVENIDADKGLAVVGHSCNPVEKTSVVQFDKQSDEHFKSNADAIMDGFIEDLQEALESNKLTGRLKAYGHLSGSPNSYMRELLEHFDKSTEPLHMPPTTPRTATWQSKLLETIDRDIDNILLEQEAAFLGKEKPGANMEHHRIDHTRYDSIEL